MNSYSTFQSVLNTLPDELKQTIYCVEQAVQSPLPLITTSLLSSLSSAVQGYIDIETVYGAVQPVSIFSLVIAESGERKSSTDRLLSKPLLALDMEEQSALRRQHAKTKIDQIAWDAKYKALEKQLQRAIQSDPEEIRAIKDALVDLWECKPDLMEATPTILNDVTSAALLQTLAGNGKVVTLASSDAGNLFSRTNMDFMSSVNQIWDGEDVTVARKTGNQVINNGRLTLSLMVQPSVLMRTLERKDNLLRMSGYLARMLVTMPLSTQGHRLNFATSQDDTHLKRFHHRLMRLAKESILHQAAQQRVTLKFTPEATKVMQDFYRVVEVELREKASLASIRDAGSKIVDNATRIAALIHAYQHGASSTEVDANTAAAACHLSTFYLGEFATVFGEKTVQQQAEENGNLLHQWLQKNGYAVGGHTVTLTMLMRYGPYRIRKRADLDLAIDALCRKGVLEFYPYGKPAYVRWAETWRSPLFTMQYTNQ